MIECPARNSHAATDVDNMPENSLSLAEGVGALGLNKECVLNTVPVTQGNRVAERSRGQQIDHRACAEPVRHRVSAAGTKDTAILMFGRLQSQALSGARGRRRKTCLMSEVQ